MFHGDPPADVHCDQSLYTREATPNLIQKRPIGKCCPQSAHLLQEAGKSCGVAATRDRTGRGKPWYVVLPEHPLASRGGPPTVAIRSSTGSAPDWARLEPSIPMGEFRCLLVRCGEETFDLLAQ
jgi:hypothetical protein